MQIKITMSYHFTRVEMTTTKKKNKKTNQSEKWGEELN